MALLLLLITGFIASVLGALSGFGVSVVMMPVLALAIGERDAVPALTIATLVGNLSRVWFNREALRLSAAGWYLLGAAPAAALGGILFAKAPERLIAVLMAAFLFGAVVYRNWRKRASKAPRDPMPERRLATVGLFTGMVSALVGGAGPLVVPFFLAAGLTKSAFIGTEALAAAGVHIVKLLAYGGARAMSSVSLWVGAVTAPAIIAGAWSGKRITDRVSERTFTLIVEGMMIVAALLLLARAGRWLH
ncbi:MAG: sulfite exporter TauE/SafE family protein [Planctomycetes bacterium]|nr:sulfite exporter TauE/SafE family protein [Planctomycetota bacterium]